MPSEITKNNIDDIFRDLGKEYRKIYGKTNPAEIVIVGGACIIANYNFRKSSFDVDGIIRAGYSIREAAAKVEEKYGLEHGWLNSDFMRTESYSEKLLEHSRYYKTFSNVLEIRTVEPAYLVATKLCSAREYKHDLSDVIGIISEQYDSGFPLEKQDIINAYNEMYAERKPLQDDLQRLLDCIFECKSLVELFEQYETQENENKDVVVGFTEKYPDAITESNCAEILELLLAKNTVDADEDTEQIDDVDAFYQ